MRRICCFCETWESGGIESFLNNVLLRLDMQEFEIDLVAACIRPSVFTQGLKEHGIRFVELSGNQHNLLKNHRMFRCLLEERRYDVVHLNIFQGVSLYYAYLAKQAGVSVRIAHSHNTALRKSRTQCLKQWIHNAAKRLFCGCATDFWACSEVAAEFLFDKDKLRVRGAQLLPNGIDTQRFCFDAGGRAIVRSELGITDCFVIGNVGRLCYQKNQDFLLDVFADVMRKHPQSRLLLIGEGAQEADLKEKAKRLEIEGAVIFYGVSNCVEQLLWAMDVFAFPSHFEGLGIVAIEAQASGLPVIASQYVPDEAKVTQLFRRLSLDAGTQAWADTLLAHQREQEHNSRASEQVREAGYDINDAVKIVESYYSQAAKKL